MLEVTIHKLGDTIVFRCTGRIVFGECHILRHAIFSHPYIAIAVLDMAQVTAMDAAGVGLLVELRKWAAAKRMKLKLLYLTPHGANLLNITHVTPIFDVCSVRDVIDLLFRANQSVVRKTAQPTYRRALTDSRRQLESPGDPSARKPSVTGWRRGAAKDSVLGWLSSGPCVTPAPIDLLGIVS